jgi:rifampicin phosphotransferase
VIVRLDEAAPDQLGGKAAGLARLAGLGLPIPPTVVVPVADAGRVDDPRGVLEALGEPLAVRSSALGEDASDWSAAGQFESLLDVSVDGLQDAVRKVHASAGSDRVRAYAGGAPPGMAVVIQRQVSSARAGVAFSIDPLTGEDAVVIECVFGFGDQLVSGEAEPDRFIVGPDGEVRASLAPKERSHRTLRTLRDDEARDVAAHVRRAAEGFGHPVDVEFCFDADGPTLWLLQCRAVTALASAQ